MFYLIVDIGNTSTKMALFKEGTLFNFKQKTSPTLEWVKRFIGTKKIEACLISDVSQKNIPITKYLNAVMYCIHMDELRKQKFNFGFLNAYKTPLLLGADRIANAAAAAHQYANGNVLVVDVGTCLKVDLILKKSFIGGSISPGLNMRFKSLHYYTGQLPHLQSAKRFAYPGNNTKTSIQSGVQKGMLFEIESHISHYKRFHKSLHIILTGGDSRLFANHLKKHIFADPFFTIKGLYYILLNYLKK